MSLRSLRETKSRELLAPPTVAWQHLKEIKDPNTYEALLYEPAGKGSAGQGSWPLLLYLHGAGESGSNVADLISEGATGTPPVALEKGNAIDALSQFVVVAPQTSRGWAPDEVWFSVSLRAVAAMAFRRRDVLYAQATQTRATKPRWRAWRRLSSTRAFLWKTRRARV